MITKPTIGDVLKTFAVMLLPIVVVNVLLYYLGNTIGAFGDSVTTPNGPITVIPVIFASIIGSILCVIFFLIIRQFTTNIAKWTQIVGYLILLLSLFNPFSITNYNILTILVLNAMHIVVAVPFIAAFVKLSRRAVIKSPKQILN
jgi:Family of unknown function (DUF6069)